MDVKTVSKEGRKAPNDSPSQAASDVGRYCFWRRVRCVNSFASGAGPSSARKSVLRGWVRNRMSSRVLKICKQETMRRFDASTRRAYPSAITRCNMTMELRISVRNFASYAALPDQRNAPLIQTAEWFHGAGTACRPGRGRIGSWCGPP